MLSFLVKLNLCFPANFGWNFVFFNGFEDVYARKSAWVYEQRMKLTIINIGLDYFNTCDWRASSLLSHVWNYSSYTYKLESNSLSAFTAVDTFIAELMSFFLASLIAWHALGREKLNIIGASWNLKAVVLTLVLDVMCGDVWWNMLRYPEQMIQWKNDDEWSSTKR